MRWLGVACLIAAGCTMGGGGTDLPDTAAGAASTVAIASAGVTAPTAATSAAAALPLPTPTEDYREAVRSFDFARAWTLLDELPASSKNSAEIRLVRGRVALALGKHADAVQALEGLETMLPLARDEIQRWYAGAAAVAGPHDEAAKLLEASPPRSRHDRRGDGLESQRQSEEGTRMRRPRRQACRAQPAQGRHRRGPPGACGDRRGGGRQGGGRRRL